MTTPADNTPISIINDAYLESRRIQEGEVPNGEQTVKGLRRLNDIVNLWQTQGLKLWLQSNLTVPLVAGQALYTIGPSGSVNMVRPLRAEEGYFLDVGGNQRPIYPIARMEYYRLSTPASQGAVSQFYIDKQQTTLNLYLWPVPDATAALGTVHLLIEQQATNPISLTETMNFPPMWRIALVWGLADELATGQPTAIMERCQARAQSYRMALDDWDVEDAPVRFTADVGQSIRRNFR